MNGKNDKNGAGPSIIDNLLESVQQDAGKLLRQLKSMVDELESAVTAKVAEPAPKLISEQVKVNLFRARKKIRTQLINTQSYGI